MSIAGEERNGNSSKDVRLRKQAYKNDVAKMLWRQSERDIGLNALMLIELQLKYGCVLLFQRNLSDKTIIIDRKDFLWDRHLQKKS